MLLGEAGPGGSWTVDSMTPKGRVVLPHLRSEATQSERVLMLKCRLTLLPTKQHTVKGQQDCSLVPTVGILPEPRCPRPSVHAQMPLLDPSQPCPRTASGSSRCSAWLHNSSLQHSRGWEHPLPTGQRAGGVNQHKHLPRSPGLERGKQGGQGPHNKEMGQNLYEALNFKQRPQVHAWGTRGGGHWTAERWPRTPVDTPRTDTTCWKRQQTRQVRLDNSLYRSMSGPGAAPHLRGFNSFTSISSLRLPRVHGAQLGPPHAGHHITIMLY